MLRKLNLVKNVPLKARIFLGHVYFAIRAILAAALNSPYKYFRAHFPILLVSFKLVPHRPRVLELVDRRSETGNRTHIFTFESVGLSQVQRKEPSFERRKPFRDVERVLLPTLRGMDIDHI